MNGIEHPSAIPRGTIQKLTRLLAAPTIEPAQRAARIQAVEKDIVLPLRALIVGILTYYFFFSGWFVTQTASKLGGANSLVPPDDWSLRHATALKIGFLVYAFFNVITGIILIKRPQLSLMKIETIMFVMGILDAFLMGTLIVMNKGFDSNLYWVFPVLILHNALAIPAALPQLVLNFLVSGGFMIGGFAADRGPVEIDPRMESSTERLIVLVAWALCCYGIQVLFEKQKIAEADATELAVRQERLQTAGRLAAEIAHKIKNPLGIITNAAFSLRRSIHEGEFSVDEQIGIIREEVDKADRIITELMGYAQLAEGTVEKLNVPDEIDNALLEVYPPAAKYKVEIIKHFEPDVPAVLMQKRHLSGILVNLLQNAREVMKGVGAVEVSVKHGDNNSVIISVADNGPGIPLESIDKIFEPYYTTREKGTGLGLAIVKHNTEMYGGVVGVESELGKGSRFTLEFPARILMRLSK